MAVVTISPAAQVAAAAAAAYFERPDSSPEGIATVILLALQSFHAVVPAASQVEVRVVVDVDVSGG